MSTSSPCPLVAVDIGNNRMKLGLFTGLQDDCLPKPDQTLHVGGDDPTLTSIDTWLQDINTSIQGWWIGSVNRPSTTRLVNYLRERRPNDPVTLLAAGDLPLRVELPRPDMVGIDRLLDAVAANRLRTPDRPAVLVDVGSAVTVDLVSADGAFRGGAILPGIAMAARALHTFTDLLPLVEMSGLTTQPPPLGTATVEAMRSGLFWGTIGAIRHLVELLSREAGSQAEVFLTGGASPVVAELLGPSAKHVPHLTLAGIALSAAEVGREA